MKNISDKSRKIFENLDKIVTLREVAWLILSAITTGFSFFLKIKFEEKMYLFLGIIFLGMFVLYVSLRKKIISLWEEQNTAFTQVKALLEVHDIEKKLIKTIEALSSVSEETNTVISSLDKTVSNFDDLYLNKKFSNLDIFLKSIFTNSKKDLNVIFNNLTDALKLYHNEEIIAKICLVQSYNQNKSSRIETYLENSYYSIIYTDYKHRHLVSDKKLALESYMIEAIQNKYCFTKKDSSSIFIAIPIIVVQSNNNEHFLGFMTTELKNILDLSDEIQSVCEKISIAFSNQISYYIKVLFENIDMYINDEVFISSTNEGEKANAPAFIKFKEKIKDYYC